MTKTISTLSMEVWIYEDGSMTAGTLTSEEGSPRSTHRFPKFFVEVV